MSSPAYYRINTQTTHRKGRTAWLMGKHWPNNLPGSPLWQRTVIPTQYSTSIELMLMFDSPKFDAPTPKILFLWILNCFYATVSQVIVHQVMPADVSHTDCLMHMCIQCTRGLYAWILILHPWIFLQLWRLFWN